MSDATFCDHCGDEIFREPYTVAQLPVDIESACKGESATLCESCYKRIVIQHGKKYPICPDCLCAVFPQDGAVLVKIVKHPTSRSAGNHKLVKFPLYPDSCPICGVEFDTALDGILDFGPPRPVKEVKP